MFELVKAIELMESAAVETEAEEQVPALGPLQTVTVCALLLVVPACWFPKERLVGTRVVIGAGFTVWTTVASLGTKFGLLRVGFARLLLKQARMLSVPVVFPGPTGRLGVVVMACWFAPTVTRATVSSAVTPGAAQVAALAAL